jgi:UDP-glucose 4-epimerase
VVGISSPFDSPRFLKRLIAVAASRGVTGFAFSSSGGTVYGEQVSEAGWKEESVLAPISIYGVAKASAEKVVQNECNSRKIRSLIWRFSNLFGPDQALRAGHGLIPAAINAANAGGVLELLGGRSMVRDFAYVDDAVRAAVETLRTRRMQSIFNIGSGTGRQVGDVLDLVEHAFGGTISAVDVEKPAGFVEKNILDTSKLRKEFPGLTFRSLEEGIRQLSSVD